MNYYDDNFGHWDDMDDSDMIEFYFYVQDNSIEKECAMCGGTFMLLPGYGYCDSCATKREMGWDY